MISETGTQHRKLPTCLNANNGYRNNLARSELVHLVAEIECFLNDLKTAGKLDPTFPARLDRIKKALGIV